MFVENLNKLIRIWRREKLNLSMPNSEKQVIDCFLSIKRPLSKDILTLYTNFGGMIDGDMAESLLSVWTVERIVEENITNSELTCFADYMIHTHSYAFSYENEKISSVYSNFETPKFIKIADSVEQFFELCLTNPEKVDLY